MKKIYNILIGTFIVVAVGLSIYFYMDSKISEQEYRLVPTGHAVNQDIVNAVNELAIKNKK